MKIDEFKLELLRQHLNSIRHAEDERLTFTEFFILAVAGSLAFISQKGLLLAKQHWMIYFCLAGFSLLGFLVSLRLNRGITIRRNTVNKIIEEAKMKKYRIYGGQLPKTKLPSLRFIFLALYSLAFILFAIMTVLCLLN